MTEKERVLDRDVHKMIEEQHELLSEIHRMQEEQLRTRDRDGDTDKGK